MHTPISNFLRAALATSSSDLLVGRSNPQVRRDAVHFLVMSMMLGAILIAMRWTHLSSIESIVGSQRLVTLPGGIALELAWGMIYLAAIACIGSFKPGAPWVIRITLIVVVLEGIAVMLRWALGYDPGPGGNALAGILIVLTLGASLLPWSPRQTLALAVSWIVGASATLLTVTPGEGVSIGATIFGYISVTIPGIMVSFFRTTRVHDRSEIDYFQSRYERIEQELASARNIHERAFPLPKTTGSVRFAYSYRPMSQIGGDYLFASTRPGNPDAPVLVVLLDVSGHGIPAALTVNRLQGELMQLVGERPDAGAGQVLTRLNSYICITNPENPVLVSGIAARIDPASNSLEIANAGHPGALLRESTGNLTEIDSTGPLMGIDPESSVTWDTERFPFNPGDALIAFTDGVTEAMDNTRRMYGTEGIRGVIQSQWLESGQRWPELIRRSVDRYCEGEPKDDMLIVDVYRPQGM